MTTTFDRPQVAAAALHRPDHRYPRRQSLGTRRRGLSAVFVSTLLACTLLALAAGTAVAQTRDFGIQIVNPSREVIRELAPFASIVTLSSDHPELQDLVRYANTYGLKVSLYAEPMFFDVVGNQAFLWNTYRTRWQNFVALNADVIHREAIWAIYLVDEPFHRGVPVEDLEAVQRLVEKSFPLIPTVTSLNIFDLQQVPPDLPNDVLDIVGLHMYAVPGLLAENADFQLATSLLQQHFPHRQKMLVADTWWTEGRHGAIDLSVEDVGERFVQYRDAAQAMGAETLGAFLWENFPGGTGLREFPSETLRSVQNLAAELSGKCGIPEGADPLDGGHFLFFQDCRFVATVAWSNPADGTGGDAVSVSISEDTGFFWFFNDRNVELTLKLLDGRGTNDHWWVFWSDMTTLDITVTLTDTLTGAVRTYTEPTSSDITAFAEP